MNLREASKLDLFQKDQFGVDQELPNLEGIRAGCLQRIADRLEQLPTKRELFAAMAMEAIIAKAPFCFATTEENLEEFRVKATQLARGAVGYADALIAELERGAK